MHIFIADDHAVVRRGLRQILAEEFPQAEFGEAGTAAAALAQTAKGKWDIVITDVTMPGRSGLDLLKDLKAARPKLPVLVLSVHPEDQFAGRVIKAGAAGYLNKDSAPTLLVAAVRKVLAGGCYVSDAFAQHLAADLRTGADKPPLELLSDREFEVLRHLAAGRQVKEISGELGLSVKTISTYRMRLLKKLDLRTTADLLRYANQHGLL